MSDYTDERDAELQVEADAEADRLAWSAGDDYTRDNARPIDAADYDAGADDDPRVQLIAAAIDFRLRQVLSTVEALTEAIGILNDIDDKRGAAFDALYSIVTAQGEVLAQVVESVHNLHSVKV